MAEHREPNLDDDGSKSSFQKTVVLRDWWLVKCPKEFQGKRFGVAGIEDSVETRAMRVFTSSPIIRALDVFTLLASDGIYINLRGFLNKGRVFKNGFTREICREFIYGFPPCWERICNNCFGGGVSLGTDTNTVPSTIAKASYSILSPCKSNKENLEDSPAERSDESTVPDANTAEINNTKDSSRARDKKIARRKSLPLQTKSGGKGTEDERILESSKVHNTTNDGDHGSEGLHKGKSGDVEKDECEAINNEDDERKLDESKLQNLTSNDGDHGTEGLDKAKSGDVEKDECEAIDDGVISPADGCGRNHSAADNVDRVTSTSATGESLTSEQQKGKLKVTTASPHSLLKDLVQSSKLEKKGISKKSRNTLKNDGNVVVAPSNYSEVKGKSAENKRKPQNLTTNDRDRGKEGLNNAKSDEVEKDDCVAINDEVISPVDGCGRRHSGTDGVEKLTSKNATEESLTSEQRKGRVKETKTSLHSLSKDLNNNSSKPTKKGKSKKSEKTLKRDRHAAEETFSSESEENLSWGNTKRKIDFDVEVTPDNKVKKKKKTNAVSTDSLGQKRSKVTPDNKVKKKKTNAVSTDSLGQKRSMVTPDKKVKKQKTNAVSTDSLGQKRSRSGRVLVSSLAYWRNQIPVYDMDRNLIQVKDGHETNSTPSKGKGSNSRKPRR